MKNWHCTRKKGVSICLKWLVLYLALSVSGNASILRQILLQTLMYQIEYNLFNCCIFWVKSEPHFGVKETIGKQETACCQRFVEKLLIFIKWEDSNTTVSHT